MDPVKNVTVLVERVKSTLASKRRPFKYSSKLPAGEGGNARVKTVFDPLIAPEGISESE